MVGQLTGSGRQIVEMCPQVVLGGSDLDLLPGMDLMKPLGACGLPIPGFSPAPINVETAMPITQIRLHYNVREFNRFARRGHRIVDRLNGQMHRSSSDIS